MTPIESVTFLRQPAISLSADSVGRVADSVGSVVPETMLHYITTVALITLPTVSLYTCGTGRQLNWLSPTR